MPSPYYPFYVSHLLPRPPLKKKKKTPYRRLNKFGMRLLHLHVTLWLFILVFLILLVSFKIHILL